MFIPLLIVLLILTFNGLILFSFFSDTKNKLLKLGGGMIIGPLGFLFILSIASYIFKGPMAINILFFLYFFFCIYLFRKYKVSLNLKFDFQKHKIILGILCFYIFLLIRLYPFAVSSINAGSYIYNSIATSFARGNFPTVLPNQPQFLTGYHHGAFILEGALNSISPISNIEMTHHVLATYLLIAIFLFTTGIAREYIRSIYSLIPAVAGLVSFSGHNFLGGGAKSLEDLYSFIFYTLGLSAFILFLYFLNKKSSRVFLKYIWLVFLMVLILSIDETFFMICLPIYSFYFFIDNKKKFFIKTLVALLVGVFLFFIIQNPIRDSLLSPKSENSRFSLLYPKFINANYPKDNLSYKSALQGGLGDDQNIKQYITVHTITERLSYLNTNIIIFLIVSIYFGFWWSNIFLFSFLVAFLAGTFITNTYYINNYYRFLNLGFELQMFCLGFLIIHLSQKFNTKNLFLIIMIGFFLLPIAFENHQRIIKEAFFTKVNLPYFNFKDDLSSFIKPNDKIIFVGSALSNIQTLTLQGYLIPMGPIKTKVLTPEDVGIEFYDATYSLSPYALRDLKIDLVFILNEGLKILPEERLKQISDENYFKKIHENKNGKLYSVSDNFRNLKDDTLDLKKITLKIPEKSVVYLDKFDDLLIPKVIIGEISKKINLVGFPYVQGEGNYLYIETFLPYYPVCVEIYKSCGVKNISDVLSRVDYILANPKTDPQKIMPGEYIKQAELPYLILWKNME